MPSYRTDVSGFPVLTSEDGTDQVAQEELYDVKRPPAVPRPAVVQGVAGFAAGASNSTPGGAAQAGYRD